jgi:hypothetical protein
MATGSAASAGQVTHLRIWPIAERFKTEHEVRDKIRFIYFLKSKIQP